MDARINDEFDRSTTDGEYDNFLLDEGLEVLAHYRSIRDEAVRGAVKQLIASLARADYPPNQTSEGAKQSSVF